MKEIKTIKKKVGFFLFIKINMKDKKNKKCLTSNFKHLANDGVSVGSDGQLRRVVDVELERTKERAIHFVGKYLDLVCAFFVFVFVFQFIK